jgi:hypothetical protein
LSTDSLTVMCLTAAYPIEMVNMVLQDAQPKVVIVSPTFFPNVKDAGVSVLELVPTWEDTLVSSADAAAAFVAPVMVRDLHILPLYLM